MKKVLVTGGTGYIGSHTTVELITAGYEVIIIDNLSNSHAEVLDSIQQITGVRPAFFEFDLCNRSDVVDFFNNHTVDAVIHFAAFKSVGDSVAHPLKYYHNNLLSLINLLTETRNLNLVFSSSCSVYGDTAILPVTENTPLPKPASPYGNTKQISEEILSDCCKANKRYHVVALRYFNPAGAHSSSLIGEYPLDAPDNLVPVITQTAIGKRKELVLYGGDYNTPDGTCIRDYIHVVDVAKAHVLAVNRLLEKRGIQNYEVYNLGTGMGSSVLEAVKAFEKVAGTKLNYRIGSRRDGDVEKVYADTSKANKELGWKTVHTLDDIMSSAWAWEQALSEKAAIKKEQVDNLQFANCKLPVANLLKMKQYKKNILITGGAGFIGSHVVRLFVNTYPDYKIYNLDKLTYAGNLANLHDVENSANYEFIKGDIVDANFIQQLFVSNHFDSVIHLAAESHVDRSISNPMEFIMTNVVGTVNLLNASRSAWQTSNLKPQTSNLFYHISTDEVYGSLGKSGFFTEETKYDPHSPYSASKASSDHFVRAYADTYNLPVIISNCSNNYGPYHFPEKLIPLAIHNILQNKPIPVYGKGENIRDWLYVEDHAKAIDLIFHKGKKGETYNIGGHNEWTNIDLINLLCKIADKKLNRQPGATAKLITFVKDRAGHDLRYAIDSSKIQRELGWKPSLQFEEGLEKTFDWYLANRAWTNNITSGDYMKYYEAQYVHR